MVSHARPEVIPEDLGRSFSASIVAWGTNKKSVSCFYTFVFRVAAIDEW